MGFWAYVFQDWRANPSNPKIQLALAAFRLTQRIAQAPRPLYLLGVPVLVLYRVTVDWILGLELHWNLRIGPRLQIYHGRALVLHPDTVIGEDCILRHCTTTGLRETTPGEDGGAPVLGDRVNVGPHCIILGPVHVGDDAVIGAGSVVVRDVPADATVAGNPARVVGSAARAEPPGSAEPPGGGPRRAAAIRDVQLVNGGD